LFRTIFRLYMAHIKGVMRPQSGSNILDGVKMTSW